MKKFSIKLAQDPHEVFAKFKATAEKNGVGLKGDHQLGHFSGKGIEGHYELGGDVLNITIVKKPFLFGWPMIETKVRDFFA